jgi:transglutaminase-like putative cysteine protease
MTGRRHMGAVAGAATLLAAAPLSAIFSSWVWFMQCAIAVAMVAGAATVARSLRAPVWAQLLAMGGALTLILTWLFPSHDEILGVVPSQATFDHFGALLNSSVTDMQEFGVPVPDEPALLFVTVLGVGAVAIVVDLFTVGLRRPALAGLPMLAIYSVPVAVYTDSVPMLPFIIGAFGFLWLLVSDNVDRVRRFGRRFTGDGRDVDVWEPSPLAAAGRRLAVVGVVLAVALPFAVPGMTTGLLERFGTVGSGDGTGTGRGNGSGTVDLFAELSGQLTQDRETPLIKVTTTDPDPFYMRFAVADDITTDGFRSRAQRGRPAGVALPGQVAPFNGVVQNQYHATVQSVGFNMPLLPLYTQATKLDGVDNSWFYDQSTNVVYSNRSRTKSKRYSFDYVTSEYSAQALRTAPQLTANDPIERQFTQVPAVREIQNMVQDLTSGKSTPYDKVRAIYDYFSRDNGFKYSLQTQSGTSGSAIVDFLTNKTGFCEQYAAAMAWLVRAAGIPARVAFGFTRGNQRDGDAYVLTNRNLHAWTEVYFSGFGWVPFDATPSASVAGAVDPAWAPNTDSPSPTSSPGASSTDPGANPTATSGATDPGANARQDPTSGGGVAIEPNASNWTWWTLAGALLILGMLAIPALRRILLRRHRRALFRGGAPESPTSRGTARAGAAVVSTEADQAGADGSTSDAAGVESALGKPGMMVVTGDAAAAARAAAHAAWDELLDTMIDFRLRVDSTETPRATAERLVGESTLGNPAADGVRLAGRAEERARYARDPIGAEGLVPALRTVRQALARRARRRTRIAAVLMPPSVLLRWRLAIMDSSTGAINTLARWRDALSPRRLLTRQ